MDATFQVQVSCQNSRTGPCSNIFSHLTGMGRRKALFLCFQCLKWKSGIKTKTLLPTAGPSRYLERNTNSFDSKNMQKNVVQKQIKYQVLRCQLSLHLSIHRVGVTNLASCATNSFGLHFSILPKNANLSCRNLPNLISSPFILEFINCGFYAGTASSFRLHSWQKFCKG